MGQEIIKNWKIHSADEFYEWVDKMHEALIAMDKIPLASRPHFAVTLEVKDHDDKD